MPATVYDATEGQKFSGDITLVVLTCATCHIAYAIPESLHAAALKWRGDRHDGRGWKLCCPLGHTWWYTGPNAEDKAKRRAQRAEDRAARLRAELDQAKADARAQKARGTRFKNDRDRERKRAAAGVCPCCNRTFQNLARHMEGQHPGFVTDKENT